MDRMPHTVAADHPRVLGRRAFVRSLALGGAALALPTPLIAHPYARARTRDAARRPVRIRGQVRVQGRGLGGVGVTDGLSVVDSAPDGGFELVTTAQQELLSICVPSGFEIPRNPTGTARFYQPIRPNPEGVMDALFDLVPLRHSDERHAFLLLADIHLPLADIQTTDAQKMNYFHEETVPDLLQVLGQLGDVDSVGVACGDIIHDHPELFPDYERAVSRLGIPFFQVVGNHDMDYEGLVDEASTATFSRHFGPRYYSFDRGEVHYVVLDDVFWHGVGYIGYLDRDQLTWLENDLARVEPGRTVIVSLHIPVLGSSHIRNGLEDPRLVLAVANRDALYRLLEPYEAHVLAGHTHENEHVFEGGVHEHVSGAVCGAWWSGPICSDGTPNGYSVFEINGSAVSWRYKPTGHAFDHQMRTYPRGSDPEAPDEIVANVWDWDPEWTVVWYEDGERRGAMARRVGLDPLAAKLHTGPELPARRTWVEPNRTAHLFYAPASRRASEIRVEARDRFGRVYSALVPLAPEGG
jgi:hypothetical protein